jgi:hypothetical protein
MKVVFLIVKILVKQKKKKSLKQKKRKIKMILKVTKINQKMN